MTVKQARDCRVGDIILYKNEESQMITDIDHRGKAHFFRTTNLKGEDPRFDTHDASEEVTVWGSQEVLF